MIHKNTFKFKSSEDTSGRAMFAFTNLSYRIKQHRVGCLYRGRVDFP
jgi:hypothetical protein